MITRNNYLIFNALLRDIYEIIDTAKLVNPEVTRNTRNFSPVLFHSDLNDFSIASLEFNRLLNYLTLSLNYDLWVNEEEIHYEYFYYLDYGILDKVTELLNAMLKMAVENKEFYMIGHPCFYYPGLTALNHNYSLSYLNSRIVLDIEVINFIEPLPSIIDVKDTRLERLINKINTKTKDNYDLPTLLKHYLGFDHDPNFSNGKVNLKELIENLILLDINKHRTVNILSVLISTNALGNNFKSLLEGLNIDTIISWLIELKHLPIIFKFKLKDIKDE